MLTIQLVNGENMYSESHGHLRNLRDEVIEQALTRATEKGVDIVLTAGIDLDSSAQAIKLARRFKIIKACIGIHPWNADQYSESALTQLKALAQEPEVVAISEIGLDYVGRMNRDWIFVPEYVDKGLQRKAFIAQLRLAKELALPVLVHDRTPDYEVLATLEQEANVKTGIAIHSFTKDRVYAQRCIRHGIYLSIGVRDVLAPENTALREAIQLTPLNWLLTETDSPNPVDSISVAEKIAELKGLTPEEVGEATTQNLRRLIQRL
jgi:TatD DNase family protein